jgi:hypothetical protein
MIYLIYRSIATDVPSEAELVSLLKHARPANAARGITGMLLYQNGRYMQMLEGEEPVVKELFAAISADRRHRDVKLVAKGALAKRHFDDWSMGFRNMDQFADLPDYDTYLSRQLDEGQLSPDERAAFRFMFHFIESA